MLRESTIEGGDKTSMEHAQVSTTLFCLFQDVSPQVDMNAIEFNRDAFE